MQASNDSNTNANKNKLNTQESMPDMQDSYPNNQIP